VIRSSFERAPIPAAVGARLLAAAVFVMTPGSAAPASGQGVEDPTRLAGLDRVQVRAEAEWDELITVEAGGATPEQFEDALRQTFERTIASADAAPSVVPGAPVTVACHVDTFYDMGLIVYGLRAQVESPGPDGQPVVVWIKSWVGSYTAQQLHLMFSLGEQCADSFLEDWKSVN
jgi:hypothetical protein